MGSYFVQFTSKTDSMTVVGKIKPANGLNKFDAFYRMKQSL